MIEEKGYAFDYFDLTKESIDFDLLVSIYNKNDIPLKKYFNSSGVLYRELKMKDKFETSTDLEMLKYISENGLLLKRPFIIMDNNIYIGKDFMNIK